MRKIIASALVLGFLSSTPAIAQTFAGSFDNEVTQPIEPVGENGATQQREPAGPAVKKALHKKVPVKKALNNKVPVKKALDNKAKEPIKRSTLHDKAVKQVKEAKPEATPLLKPTASPIFRANRSRLSRRLSCMRMNRRRRGDRKSSSSR